MTRALLFWALASVAAAQPQGAVAGRLVIFDDGEPLTIAQAEREIGGDPITLELRQGYQVYEARLERDGHFVLEAPPGKYRFEYLRLGDRAEFIPPQELTIEGGALTCAGTLAVDTGAVANLGVNVESRLEVTDDCEKLWPKLRRLHDGPSKRVAPARAGPAVEHPQTLGWVDRMAMINVEAALGNVSAVRVTYEHPLFWQPDAPVGLILTAAGGWLLSVDGRPVNGGGTDFMAGGGIEIYGVSLAAVAGYRQAVSDRAILPGGLVLGAWGKLPLGPIGLGVRLEALPTVSVAWFLDLSPVALMGVLL